MRITIVINNHNERTLTIKTIPNMAVKREREKKDAKGELEPSGSNKGEMELKWQGIKSLSKNENNG